MPSAGDFVTRGLPAPVRREIDPWITTHIAQIAKNAQHWPEGGVRVTLELDQQPWLWVIEPSEDSVGRLFPIAAGMPMGNAARSQADQWADAAWAVLLTAVEGQANADAVQTALAGIARPVEGGTPMQFPLVWWDRSPSGPPAAQLSRLAQISSG